MLNLFAITTFAQTSPYPASQPITSITWHWETRQTAALGSDLWPVTWGPDDNLYLSWGDGGGFGGSDSDGRVAMGFARLEGSPEHFHGFNINGGKNPEHPSSFPKKGKTGGLLFDHGVLYSLVNLQDGMWPHVTHVLAWSTNNAATWTRCDWTFPKGADEFQPARFINFGKDGDGVPALLTGFIYFYGHKQGTNDANPNLYLARTPRDRLRERSAIQFFAGLDARSQPTWQSNFTSAQPIFTDPHSADPAGLVYDPALKRFLLSTFHGGPGQLGIFEAPQPWGPWSTVSYYNDWGGMGQVGDGLTCEFPQKWMSADGTTMWAIFSVYGDGAKKGINAHDRFNLVKVTLSLVTQTPSAKK